MEATQKPHAAPFSIRIFSFIAALIAAAVWFLLAVRSYPIIVIADSDLGASAMERVHDFTLLALLSLGTAVAATRMIRWPASRIGLVAVLLGTLVSCSFESTDTSAMARYPLMAILALIVVAEFGEFRRRRNRPCTFFGLAGLALLLPCLLVVTDRQGRIYLGKLPAQTTPRPAEWVTARTSVSLMDGNAAAQAVSQQTRLRASGGDAGRLTVASLDGGPAFRLPSRTTGRMLQVLSFSPDGRTLAVAYNDRRYKGSVITVWDVTPADADTPPSVVPRRTLRGHGHQTFSLDFFPDGRTLISANGDKSVRLWDVVTGREQARFMPHIHRTKAWGYTHANCVATAPDGRTFVTWAYGCIKLWDRESLKPLRVLDTQDGIPCSLGFSPDGRHLVAVDRESANLWAVRPNPTPFSLLLACTAGLLGWMFCSAVYRTSPTRKF